VPYAIVVLGTAGSGKTTLTAALANYLLDNELDAVTVNLDPAVETLPYKPDVDVRNYVDARELMSTLGLGPNGALIAAIDMLTLNLDQLKEEIDSLRTNYIVIDTPGQMELFAFRETGPLVIKNLVSDMKSVALFLIDVFQAAKPATFFSSLLLAASTQVRMGLPQINVLTKIDLVEDAVIQQILDYYEDPETFAEKVVEDRGTSLIWRGEDLIVLLSKLVAMDLIPVSSTKNVGFDDLYACIQRVVAGGEDYYTEEPSPRL